MMRKYIIGLCAVLLLVFSACGSGDGNDGAAFQELHGVGHAGRPAPTPTPATAPMPAAAPAPTPPPLAEMPMSAMDAPVEVMYGGSPALVEWEDIAHRGTRHIIQNAHITMEADAAHFDEAVAALRLMASEARGYVESELLTRTGLPRLTIVLRVPAASFDEVLQRVEAVAEVVSQQQSAQDVTDQFYDMAGSLATRRIEEERILDLIDRTTELNELLALETRLSGVRLIIQSYLSQLNLMAAQVAYSTISVTLSQTPEPEEYEEEEAYYVAEIPPPTLGERIGDAFGNSVDGTVIALQNFVVFAAGAVIPLLLLVILGIVIWQVGKRVRQV